MRLLWLGMLIVLSCAVHAEMNYLYEETATHGEVIKIILDIEDATVNGTVIVGEHIPPLVEFREWVILGAEEDMDDVYFEQDGQDIVWKFTARQTHPRIVYSIRTPDNGTNITLDSVFALSPTNIGRRQALIGLVTAEPVQIQQPAPTDDESFAYVWVTAGIVFLLTVLSIQVWRRHRPAREEVVEHSPYVYSQNQYPRTQFVQPNQYEQQYPPRYQ